MPGPSMATASGVSDKRQETRMKKEPGPGWRALPDLCGMCHILGAEEPRIPAQAGTLRLDQREQWGEVRALKGMEEGLQ